MRQNEFIDGLCAEADDAVRALLRRAYDHGFREGLASSGQPAASPEEPLPTGEGPQLAPAPPATLPGQPPAAVPPQVAWSERSGGDEEDAREADDEDDDAPESTAVRPILPLATVGTLRRRITRTFDLERFDIDVVICRSGDPDRRQLKSSVRLSSYRKEEG